MNWLIQLELPKKVSIAFAACLCMALILGLAALQQIVSLTGAESSGVYRSSPALIGGLLVVVLLLIGAIAFATTRAVATSIANEADKASKHKESTMTALSAVGERMTSFRDGLSGLADNTIAVGDGDLIPRHIHHTEYMKWDRTDEIGELSRTFDAMLAEGIRAVEGIKKAQHSLSNLVGEARSAASSISTSAAEIASGNHDLSNRTSEQASSLEETAASMEEMTSIVRQNADNARNANKLAADARTVAEAGGLIVDDAVTSMRHINASSKQISDIVSVIDEIAFQTNLLALNAAVEAARVGEQGRGFAVVASEVRNLAGRSSTAAKEIKALVQNSVREVGEGTELVNKSGAQLKEIVVAVNRVADIVTEITAASQEQSSGIEQVNKAVIQMDEITQQNAALVEEAAAASQTMAAQASQLADQMGRFKVDNGQTGSAFVAQPQPRIISVEKAQGITPVKVSPSKPRRTLALAANGARDNMEEF